MAKSTFGKVSPNAEASLASEPLDMSAELTPASDTAMQEYSGGDSQFEGEITQKHFRTPYAKLIYPLSQDKPEGVLDGSFVIADLKLIIPKTSKPLFVTVLKAETYYEEKRQHIPGTPKEKWKTEAEAKASGMKYYATGGFHIAVHSVFNQSGEAVGLNKHLLEYNDASVIQNAFSVDSPHGPICLFKFSCNQSCFNGIGTAWVKAYSSAALLNRDSHKGVFAMKIDQYKGSFGPVMYTNMALTPDRNSPEMHQFFAGLLSGATFVADETTGE